MHDLCRDAPCGRAHTPSIRPLQCPGCWAAETGQPNLGTADTAVCITNLEYLDTECGPLLIHFMHRVIEFVCGYKAIYILFNLDNFCTKHYRARIVKCLALLVRMRDNPSDLHAENWVAVGISLREPYCELVIDYQTLCPVS